MMQINLSTRNWDHNESDSILVPKQSKQSAHKRMAPAPIPVRADISRFDHDLCLLIDTNKTFALTIRKSSEHSSF